MKLYADAPGRRSAQLTGDLLVLGWVALWVWLGRVVHDLVVQLATPVGQMKTAGGNLATSLAGASSSIGDLPLVGEALRVPLDRAAQAGTNVETSSAELISRIQTLGTGLGILVAAVPIVLVVGWWVWRRLAFARSAAVAQRFVDADADLDLFALRALASQPLERLARISDDPAGAWRRGDPQIVRALATMELRDAGLSLPPGSAAR
ncbi:hypothetical protein MM440_14540 [Arsenicicoccus piscis]|uniref:Uncharacterized protein n=1 Tax=Arsenicicoccus piscis TaxID=673954 RepID=A0ABQ6HNC3_9MICO|nr:hypothetical protein [Arsenicicoccus piscis]MCH8628951.1 hypothetical protein [Arsenicicoccus piscis]GMA19563.1 hypothetical protein GCM10025862_15840 [Arsenicicoccus piscis]